METWSWGRTVFDSTQHCIGTQLTLGVAIATRRLEILLPERESWIRWHFTDMIVHLHDSIFYLLMLQLPWHAELHKMIFTTLCMHWSVISFLHSGLTISQYPTLHTHMQLLKQLAWTGRWLHPIVHFIYSIMLLIWRSTGLKNLPHLLSKWLLECVVSRPSHCW